MVAYSPMTMKSAADFQSFTNKIYTLPPPFLCYVELTSGFSAPLWREPHGDRQQEIVIIGQSLDRVSITKA